MTGPRGVLAWMAQAMLSLALLLGLWVGPAQAFDNPDLLPDHPTPVATGAHVIEPVPVAIRDPRHPADSVFIMSEL